MIAPVDPIEPPALRATHPPPDQLSTDAELPRYVDRPPTRAHRRDQLDFGFIVGANIIPHVQVMCDMLPEEFAALEAAYAPPAADIKGAAE